MIEREFGPGSGRRCNTRPVGGLLDRGRLADAGATPTDIAAALRHLTYRRTSAPYVPRSAIEQDLLDREEFAAVFDTSFLQGLGDTGGFGPGRYTGSHVEPGIPPRV